MAAQYSEQISILSRLDHGTALLLERCGIQLTSSASLVQRHLGVLNQHQINSHETAAKHLYETVEHVWEKLKNERDITTVSEGMVQRWILDEFASQGLVTDHPPIVAVGKNSANPHYSPEGDGSFFAQNQILQLDIFAKKETGIYADISWVGFLGSDPPQEVSSAFKSLLACRDSTLLFMQKNFADNGRIRGLEVDKHTRAALQECGFGKYLRHRTGHAIDWECHGIGVNIDSIEFPDERTLLDGSCFSIEPGIYFPDYGLRTEIDVYISEGLPVVSGKAPQNRLLTLA